MVKSKKEGANLVFVLFVIALLILAFFIIKPYLTAIIVALILGFIFYPIYNRLNNLIKNRTVAALIVSALLVLIFFILVGVVADVLISESVSFFKNVGSKTFDNILNTIGGFFGDSIDLEFYLKDFIRTTAKFFVNVASGFVVSIPGRLLSFFVMIFTLFYVFKDGLTFVSKVKDALPLDEEHKQKIFENMKNITKALIFGYVLVGLAQGILGGLGFLIFGFKNPVLWGVVMAVLAMIPFTGTMVIWLPAGIVALLNQDYFSGIGIIIWGTLFVSSIDNFIRPKVIGNKAKIHPVVILLGLLGGLSLFGFIGIFVGPIVLSIILGLLNELKKHYF